MLPTTIPYMAWLVTGALLIILEFVVPGAVVIFFGMGAFLTGIVVWAGWITDIYMQFLFWIASSMFLVLLLRQQIMKIFPAIEKNDFFDEAEDIRGKMVLVIEPVESGHENGRVRFQGTTYKARSTAERIEAGMQAEVVMRDNLLLVVKKAAE